MTLLTVEKVGHISDCLSGESFNGFPVIEQDLSVCILSQREFTVTVFIHHIFQNRVTAELLPQGTISGQDSSCQKKESCRIMEIIED